MSNDQWRHLLSKTTGEETEEPFEEIERRVIEGLLGTRITTIVDREGTVRFASDDGVKALGYSETELLQRRLWETALFSQSPSSQKGVQSGWKGALEGERFQRQLEIFTKDGIPVPALLDLRPLKDGEGNVVSIVAEAEPLGWGGGPTAGSQINETKAALLASEHKFQAIFDRAQDMLLLTDMEGKLLDVNARVTRLLGYTKEEIVGVSVFDPGFLHPSEIATIVDRFQEATAQTHLPPTLFDLQLRHKTGTFLPVEVATSLIEIAGKACFLVVCRDISERKQTEARFQHYANELARSNAELEQFAYAASHDLQEPLRTVKSYVQLLQQRYKGKLGAEADEFIFFAVDAATRMQALIEGLLSYSRVATGGHEFQPVDTEVLFCRVLANLQVALEESDAVVTHDPLPPVMGDELQLGQVLQNLLSNALKFRREEAPRVHVSAERQEKMWVFRVRDQGIGIDPQFGERVFGLFQRLHPSDEFPGAGIGLALCKRIVERHGGRIWVEGQLGQGSTFFFSLPLVPITNPSP